MAKWQGGNFVEFTPLGKMETHGFGVRDPPKALIPPIHNKATRTAR